MSILMVISPAKTLDFESPMPALPTTQPDFLEDAGALIGVLRQFSPGQLSRLMDLSDPLAALNVARYASWHTPFTDDNARPALLAFNGDVYEGLDARSLSADDLHVAQSRLRILSGLYGLLRPLDLMQPYRLEMGTRLINAQGRDLYAFWGDRIALAINQALAGQASPAVVNLASEEYFKSVKRRALTARVVTPVFEDWKGGRFKVISFFAKRARGLMARYAIVNRLDEAEQLQDFAEEGYAFDPAVSDENNWVFRRRVEGVE